MPKFGFDRRGGAFSTVFGAAALVGCLSLIVPFSIAPSVTLAQTASVVEGHNLPPLPEQKIPLHKVSTPLQAVYETGVASTYGEGDGFEGNLTACGQVFHTNVVQVAHKSLPCGTMIRIEDSDTGRSVVAEVTDRGPYIAGRIVDLSWGAFRQLEPEALGLLNVTVYLLDT
jgi:rare lipoprotein A